MPCGKVEIAEGQPITNPLTKTADNHGRAYVWGRFFILDKMGDMVYNECNSFNSVSVLKAKGDRAVYRLFAFYGDI